MPLQLPLENPQHRYDAFPSPTLSLSYSFFLSFPYFHSFINDNAHMHSRNCKGAAAMLTDTVGCSMTRCIPCVQKMEKRKKITDLVPMVLATNLLLFTLDSRLTHFYPSLFAPNKLTPAAAIHHPPDPYLFIVSASMTFYYMVSLCTFHIFSTLHWSTPGQQRAVEMAIFFFASGHL